MLIKDLKDKKIMMWGLGTEGKACLDYLKRHNLGREIVIYDDSVPSQSYAQTIEGVEVIIKSPGVSAYKDEIIAAKQNGIAVTSSSDLFLSEMRQNHPQTKVIGVTGSKGKSTSVSALYHILQKAGVNAALGGNIGKALIDLLDEEHDIVVGEFSSYQATDLSSSPHIVMFTNLFSVHTDWHHGHENYCRDKIHLAANQKAGDICLVNSRNEQLVHYCRGLKNAQFYNTAESFHAEGKELFYGNEKLLNIEELKLCGNHNLDNLAGVFAIIKHLGLEPKASAESLKSFAPLPHRLQKVTTKHGVLFINDSISTAPEAAIGGMDSFEDTMGIISGGTINQQDYTEYAKYIQAHPKVKAAATLFQCGPQIAEAIKKYVTREDFVLFEVETLEEAVNKVYNEVKKADGSLVLFSPTAPSFGYYKNFMERGQDFIDIVNKLA